MPRDTPFVSDVTPRRPGWRALLVTAAAVAALGSLVAGRLTPAGEPDPALGLLIDFMALLKLATAAGAAWLIDWRLRRPAGARLALGYIAATALMAAGPGLIWQSTAIVAGAVLFHAGLLLMLVLGMLDGRVRGMLRPR